MSWRTPKNEILIAVIGVTGAGKTTFISRATGNTDLEIGRGLESCTKDVLPVPCTIDGTRVVLIDTPGFDDTYESDADIMQLIANYLATTYERKIFLSGLILLQPITGNRITGSERRRTALFKDIMGPGAYRRVMIGTTMWSQIRNQDDANRHVYERLTRGDAWEDMRDGGANVMRHDDTSASAVWIVKMLMTPGNEVILQMQEELAAHDMCIWRTSAGKRVDEDLGKEVLRLRRDLHGLQRDSSAQQTEIQGLTQRLSGLELQKSKPFFLDNSAYSGVQEVTTSHELLLQLKHRRRSC
ncbi:P-loop containing nucleoside triphosphate hydrolase protein [Aspergillus floccosus]